MSLARFFGWRFVCCALALASSRPAAADRVLVGSGDPAIDVPAVQAAVDRGGHVMLRGHFSFETTPSILPEIVGAPSATVRVSREVTVSGADDDDEEMAIIEGGQIPFLVEAHGASVAFRR